MNCLKEIDVVMSNNVLTSLYLLQFPDRPNFASFEEEDILISRFKEKQQLLEIHVALNPYDTEKYDRTKGETFAEFESENSNQMGNSKNYLQKQMYISSTSDANTGKQFVGTFQSGILYLIPITHILQMRIGLNYLDQSTISMDTQLKTFLESESDDPMAQAQLIHVKFANVNKKASLANEKGNTNTKNEAQKASRYEQFKSFDYYEKVGSETPWTQLEYHPFEPCHARHFLVPTSGNATPQLAPQKEPSVYDHRRSGGDYEEELLARLRLECLRPNGTETGPTDPSNLHNECLVAGWEAQLTQLFIKAQVLRFKQVWEFARSHLMRPEKGASLSPKEIGVCKDLILKQLQQVADIVRGCWTIKSNVLYPPSSDTAESDLTAMGGDFKRAVPRANLFVPKSNPASKNRHQLTSKMAPPCDRLKIMRRARDLVLTIYDSGPVKTLDSRCQGGYASSEIEDGSGMVITRDRMDKFIKIKCEDLTEILKGVARQRPRVGWIFKYGRDDAFLEEEMDPDTLQRLTMLGNLRKTQLLREINTSLDLLLGHFRYPFAESATILDRKIKAEFVPKGVREEMVGPQIVKSAVGEDDDIALIEYDVKLDTSLEQAYFGEGAVGDDYFNVSPRKHKSLAAARLKSITTHQPSL